MSRSMDMCGLHSLRETAGPSTALRSGRDDNLFAGNSLKSGQTNGCQ